MTSIGDAVFWRCSNLESIDLSESLTSLGYKAFNECKKLTSITLPNSLTNLGKRAFQDCSGLISIDIPNLVTSLGEKVFSGCTGLTTVTVGNAVTSIGDEAFRGCKEITSITLPESLTSIGKAAFGGCKSLTSFTIPGSVTSIGEQAFLGCSDFTDIIIEIVNGVNIEAGDLSVEPQNAVYTFCFEDRQDGDYDLNDVIIKAMRLDKTHVLFSLEACGAYDELYLRNIHGKVLNSTTEVHKMFSVDNTETFINTQGGERKPPIQDVVQVKDNYSFNNTGTEQIYIYNKTTDKEIHLSTTGEDPHGMMIPSDFKHPTETTSINKANEYFLKWTEGDNDSYDWYNKSIVDKVCQNATFEISEKIINAYPQYFNNGK